MSSQITQDTTRRAITNSSALTPAEQNLYLRRLRFPPSLEAEFHAWHYANVRGVLRVAVTPIIAFALFSLVRDLLYTRQSVYALAGNGTVLLLCLLVFGLTFYRRFAPVWQPVTACLVWGAMTIMLNSPIVVGRGAPPTASAQSARHAVRSASAFGRHTGRPAPLTGPPADAPAPLASSPADASAPLASSPAAASAAPPPAPGGNSTNTMLLVQLYTLMIFLAAFRLRFLWAMLLNCGLLLSAYWVAIYQLHTASQGLPMFSERSVLILFALMISALVQERLSRSAFLANYLLDQERDEERRKRERTEGMLHVLGQAIGGIVHDLGNPLSAVQGGAQLLEQMLDEDSDPATLKELAGMIEEGAQMLDYQRLSLMEQTRILEGKPIPVERKPTSLRRMLDASIRYQKPKFAQGRRISIDGDDLQIDVDEKKLISVFINLIGNALKYSDGQIRVVWRALADKTCIAILDQGRAGQGISQTQAGDLFVAFGRLETHTRIEGTGLGLLSTRKILEAHGGEVYIEGHVDGNAAAPLFRTGQAACPSLLPEGFVTAFVLVCPNQTAN